MTEPTVRIEKFLGLVNTAPSERLPIGALTVADDVDLDDEGGARSRPGSALALALSGVCSAYTPMDGKGRALYIVDSAGLKQIQPDMTAILLKSGLPSGEYFWAEAGNKIFYAGPAYGVIENGVVMDWRIPVPPSPALSAIPGTLPAGDYQVTCAYVATDGREGPAPVASQITLAADKAIRIQVPRGYGEATAVYISPPAGSDLYLAVITADSDYLFNEDITRLTSPLDEAQKQTDALPDVDVIAFHEGKLWGAQYFPQDDYSAVFFSQPFFFHLFNLYEDHLLIPGRVRMLASTDAGLVIGTDRQVLIHTPEEALVKLAGYGVVRGRPATTLPEGGALFWTERGVCTFPEFKNLTEKAVSLPPGNKCSTALLERGGLSQFIVLSDGLGTAYNVNF